MKTVKFRVWAPNYRDWDDNELKEIIRGTMFVWEEHAQEIAWLMSGEYHNNWGDGCILMQFTGLLDKHGKEIYEGDIIRSYGPYGEENRFIIQYGQGGYDSGYYPYIGFYCEEVETDYTDGFAMEMFEENKEVIGNIYENAELLKTNSKSVN